MIANSLGLLENNNFFSISIGHWQEIDSLFENFEYLNTIIRASDDFYYKDLSEETLIKYS